MLHPYLITGSGDFDGSSDYAVRTTGSTADNAEFVIDIILKRGSVGGNQYLCDGGSNASDTLRFNYQFTTGNLLQLGFSSIVPFQTTASFTSTSVWYRFILSISCGASGTAKKKIYVSEDSGSLSEITDFGLDHSASIGASVGWGVANANHIASTNGPASYFDGLIARHATYAGSIQNGTYSIGDFAEFETGTGYGTNGYLIEGNTAMVNGTDSSGNTDNWTTSGHAPTSDANSPTD